MLNIRNYINHPDGVKYHGQELNTTTYNLAKMNLILHGVDRRYAFTQWGYVEQRLAHR